MAATKSSRRARQFAALQPRTLNVSQSAIKKKWTKLPESSQLRVKQLFRAIERSVQCRGSGATVDIQLAIGSITNMLTRKLPRMPFPPKTEEAFFDYEATLNRTRNLETQLTADLHSVNLMKEEIEKERRLLKGDKDELQQLERALRDEESRRRRHNKGLHPLAQTREQNPGRLRAIGGKPGLPPDTVPLLRDLQHDVAMKDLLKQLRSHLESMQNSTTSIEKIPSAITTSQAALDSLSWRFLDKERYAKLHGLNMT